jgi:hypothetical protein
MTLPQSTSVLVAYNAYVTPYSSAVTVRANKLRAACGGRSSCASNLATPQTTLTLGIVGSTPTTPTVVLTGIGSAIQCENYVIDPSSSYGNAGRQWKSVEWTVVAQSSAFSSELRNISAVLNASSVYDPITIPSEYLFATTFTFTLTLTNFLGAESSASLSVVMQSYSPSSPLPVRLAFIGSTSLTGKVSAKTVVTANASFPDCASDVAKSRLSYIWTVTDLADDTVKYEGPSNSANPLQFYFNAYSLEYSHTYSVSVAAGSSTSSTSTASLTLSVAEDVVQALVFDGYTRSWPIDLDLTLDGSASRDYNVAANDAQNLLYTWTCRIVSGTTEADYGQDCGSDLFTDPYMSSSLGAYVNSSAVTIGANQMIVNGSYLFTLMVVSDSDSTRSDSVTVLVGGLESGSFYLVMNTQVTDGYPFYLSLAGSKLSLQSTIYGSAAVTASWLASFSDAAIELTGLLTQSSQVFSTAQVSNTDGITFPFAIAANILEPGRLYTFTQMACAETGGGTCSTAAIDVYVATAPTGGFLSVSPSSGTELSTSFRLSSNSWIDANTAADGYPLSYSFFYQQLSSAPYLQIRSPASTVYSYTSLPAGVASNNYVITLFGVVINSLSASTNASAVVFVNSSSIARSAEFLASMGNLLNASAASFELTGVADPVINALNGIAVSASAVNCSNAPNCTSLNRAACSTVANTCGSCLTNYSGIFGPANTGCAPITSSILPTDGEDARRLSLDVGLGIGESCSLDESCLFNYCDLQTYTCQYPNQTCPTDDPLQVCSGHGTCSFVKVANGVSLDGDCLISNSMCTAKCNCTDGYSEADCSASPSYAAELQSLRSNLCVSLNATIRKVDISSTLLDTAISSLLQSYTVSSSYDDAVQAACEDVLNYIIELADGGYLTGVKTSTLQSLTQFLSSFVVTPPPAAGSNNAMLLGVNSLINGVLDSVVLGESSQDFVADNVRVSVRVPLLSDLAANGTLSAPRSAAEEFYNTVVPALTLSSSGLDACSGDFSSSFAKLSITQLSANPYIRRAASASSMLRYSATSTGISNVSSVTNSTISRSSYYFLTFPFSSTQDFVLNRSSLAGATANITFPSCVQTDGTSATASALSCTGCNVSTYTAYNVTVLCEDITVLCPSYDSLDRRRQRRLSSVGTDTEQSVLSYGALVTAAGDEFVETLTFNPFAHLKQAKSVLIFLSILIFVIVGGLLVLLKMDAFEHNQAVYVQAEERRRKLLEAQKLGKKLVTENEKSAGQRLQDVGTLLLNVFGVGYIEEKMNMKDEKPSDASKGSPIDFGMAPSDDLDLDDEVISSGKALAESNFNDSLYFDSVSVSSPSNAGSTLFRGATTNSLDAGEGNVLKQIMKSDARVRKGIVKEFLFNVIPPMLLPRKEHTESEGKLSLLDRVNVWRQLELIFRFHEYTTFFYPSPNLSRLIRWLALWRGILLTLWVDTMFYDILFARDTACATHFDEESCLRQPSQVEANSHMCVWNSVTVQTSPSQTEVHNFCTTNAPPSNDAYVILSSALVLMFALPIDLLVGYLADEYGRYRPDMSVLQNTWLGRCFHFRNDDWLGSAPTTIAPTSLFSAMNDIQKNSVADGSPRSSAKSIVGGNSYLSPDAVTSPLERYEEEHRLIKMIDRILRKYTPSEWEARRHKKSLKKESAAEFELRNMTYSELMTRKQVGFDDEYMLKTYRANIIYDDMLPASDEVRFMLARIKKYFLDELENLSWSKDPLSFDERRDAKIEAIMAQLRVYPNGEVIPLTSLQRLRFSDELDRMEYLIRRRKTKTKQILEQMNALKEQGLPDCMDTTLLQNFVLEQMPVHKQFALSHYFFNYQRLKPPPINVFAWIGIWTLVFFLYAFLFYWMFAWGVNNAGVTLRAWAINFGLGMLQDIFALKVAKVLLQYVFVFHTARPQLKMIYRVLSHLTTLLGTEASRVQQIKLQTTFSVVQYLSASCRVAHSTIAHNLVGAAILRLVDDIDVANCRIDRNYSMGLTQYTLSGSLGTLYLYQDLLSDQVYELITPVILAAFLLINAQLYFAGGIYLAIPYIVFTVLLIYLYYFLRPARQRKSYLRHKRQMQKHIHNKAMKGATRGSSIGTAKRFRSTHYRSNWEWLSRRLKPKLDAAMNFLMLITNPLFQSWRPTRNETAAGSRGIEFSLISDCCWNNRDACCCYAGKDPSLQVANPADVWRSIMDWYHKTPAGVKPSKQRLAWRNLNMPTIRQAHAIYVHTELDDMDVGRPRPQLLQQLSSAHSGLLMTSSQVRLRLARNRIMASIPEEIRSLVATRGSLRARPAASMISGFDWSAVLGERDPRELEKQIEIHAAATPGPRSTGRKRTDSATGSQKLPSSSLSPASPQDSVGASGSASASAEAAWARTRMRVFSVGAWKDGQRQPAPQLQEPGGASSPSPTPPGAGTTSPPRPETAASPTSSGQGPMTAGRAGAVSVTRERQIFTPRVHFAPCITDSTASPAAAGPSTKSRSQSRRSLQNSVGKPLSAASSPSSPAPSSGSMHQHVHHSYMSKAPIFRREELLARILLETSTEANELLNALQTSFDYFYQDYANVQQQMFAWRSNYYKAPPTNSAAEEMFFSKFSPNKHLAMKFSARQEEQQSSRTAASSDLDTDRLIQGFYDFGVGHVEDENDSPSKVDDEEAKTTAAGTGDSGHVYHYDDEHINSSFSGGSSSSNTAGMTQLTDLEITDRSEGPYVDPELVFSDFALESSRNFQSAFKNLVRHRGQYQTGANNGSESIILTYRLLQRAKEVLPLYCPKGFNALPRAYVQEIVEDLEAFALTHEFSVRSRDRRLPEDAVEDLENIERAKLRDEQVLEHYQVSRPGLRNLFQRRLQNNTDQLLSDIVWKIRKEFGFSMELIMDVICEVVLVTSDLSVATGATDLDVDPENIIDRCRAKVAQGDDGELILLSEVRIPNKGVECKAVLLSEIVEWFYLKMEAIERLQLYYGDGFYHAH